MNRFLLLLAATMLVACSPKISSNLTKAASPLPSDEEVIILPAGAAEPENAVLLGSIKIGDNGLTATKKGTFEEVIAIAKERARLAGGNVVQITKYQAPDGVSSVNRLQANILHVDDLSPLRIYADPSSGQAHPDYAVIYFYRTSGIGPLVSYEVHVGDTPVFKAKTNSKAEVKVCEPGELTVWASTESKTTIRIKVEPGGEYYVRCAVNMGFFVGHPSLEIMDASIAKIEYESIKTD